MRWTPTAGHQRCCHCPGCEASHGKQNVECRELDLTSSLFSTVTLANWRGLKNSQILGTMVISQDYCQQLNGKSAPKSHGIRFIRSKTWNNHSDRWRKSTITCFTLTYIMYTMDPCYPPPRLLLGTSPSSIVPARRSTTSPPCSMRRPGATWPSTRTKPDWQALAAWGGDMELWDTHGKLG